ncbi:MAG TPA: twin-arginine translocation signal domain-containing protein [Vicinamibacterales bacterium]
MSDEILKRLQSRRSFLKGSALLAASALAVPAVLSAQSQDQQQLQQDQKDKPADKQNDSENRAPQDQDKPKDAPHQEAKEGDGEKTYIGADGRPYRVCPQCGSNMYKQERTWTCENCGYSYIE